MKSDQEWKYWGREDPLYAVASWRGKEVGSPGAWTDQEFAKLGESDMADVLAQWKPYGLIPTRCVEIGCGSGRMTGPLAGVFESVVALDVSADQIERAKAILGARVSRVAFHVVSEPAIPLEAGSASAMFSCHVFQHFSDFTGIESYLRETFRVLTKGGTICFHLPVPGAHLRATRSALKQALLNWRVRLKRLLGRTRVMEYHRYPADRILETLKRIGFADLDLRIFPMTSNGDLHSYFFARKP